MGRADRPPAASGQGCARRCALGSGGAGNGAGAWSGHLRIGHDPVHRPRHRYPARHRTLSRPAPWRDRRGGRRDAVPDPRRPRPRAGGHRARDLCRPGPLRHRRPRAPARGDADRVRRDRGPDQRHRRHPRGPRQPRRRPHRGQPGARWDHPPRGGADARRAPRPGRPAAPSGRPARAPRRDCARHRCQPRGRHRAHRFFRRQRAIRPCTGRTLYPGAARNRARGHPRHARLGRGADRAGRHDKPCGGDRPRPGPALHRGRQRPDHRRPRPHRTCRIPHPARGRRDHHRRQLWRGSGGRGRPAAPRAGRCVHAADGLGRGCGRHGRARQCRHPRGRPRRPAVPGPGHRPVPHGAHVLRRRTPARHARDDLCRHARGPAPVPGPHPAHAAPGFRQSVRDHGRPSRHHPVVRPATARIPAP